MLLEEKKKAENERFKGNEFMKSRVLDFLLTFFNFNRNSKKRLSIMKEAQNWIQMSQLLFAIVLLLI
jgi:hypothetical protein